MKKSAILAILLCMLTLFMFVGCNSAQDKASLIYNKKYYNAGFLDRDNIEKNKYYIIFYEDGTGEYYGYGDAVLFRFVLTEDTVHCFYDGGNENHSWTTTWNMWFWVKQDVLCDSGGSLQYINEESLSDFPNFAS